MMRLRAYLNLGKRKLRKGGKCFLDVRLKNTFSEDLRHHVYFSRKVRWSDYPEEI